MHPKMLSILIGKKVGGFIINFILTFITLIHSYKTLKVKCHLSFKLRLYKFACFIAI